MASLVRVVKTSSPRCPADREDDDVAQVSHIVTQIPLFLCRPDVLYEEFLLVQWLAPLSGMLPVWMSGEG